MFWHIFSYRIKNTVRDFQTLFWTLGFPVILASFFGMAFSNLSNIEKFEAFAIGVVDTAEYQDNSALKAQIDAVTTDSEDSLFRVTVYETKEDAEAALKGKTIAGYLLDEGDIRLYLQSTGINETILKEFMDWYLQMQSSIANITAENPAAAAKIPSVLSDSVTYISDANENPNRPNSILTFYYALIAMTCMYGAFVGVREVTGIQANQSPIAARINLAPVHKLKVFGCALLAATAVQYASILILLAYLILGLKVDFGSQLGYILLASLAGCLTGVSFGAMIGAVIKTKEGIKTAIIIGASMLMSFLAGLMYAQMKYIAVKSMPIIAYINPANLIADSFYALYYYDTHTRFFLNVGLLFAFTAVFYLVTYFVMRRQQYESL